MHSTFTGSTRKTRQVNLSGRSTANPWANFSPQKAASGTQDALAHAQAGRLQRQLEREKIIAARKVQRVWRGYESRRHTRQEWRNNWDLVEGIRRDPDKVTLPEYEEIVEKRKSVEPYEDKDIFPSQLRLLVHFLDANSETDRMRLLYFGIVLQWTQEDALLAPGLTRDLVKLGRLTAQCVSTRTDDANITRYFNMINLIGSTTETLVRNAAIYFSAISDFLANSPRPGPQAERSIANLVDNLLRLSQPASFEIYKGLTRSRLLKNGAVLNMFDLVKNLAHITDSTLLADAVDAELKEEQDHSRTTSTETQMWRLAYYVYFYRRAEWNVKSNSEKSRAARIHILGVLLSSCANDVAQRLYLEQDSDVEMNTNGYDDSVLPLAPFVRQNIESLATKASIEEVMLDLASGKGSSDTLGAQRLSKYAVALLRAFPNKASNIRMWLYQGTVRTKSSVSTIQYFWNAAQGAAVFKGISQNQRKTLSILKEPEEHSQIGRPSTKKQDTETWRDEWQVILLFLELYTFVLKPMDDEEFFSKVNEVQEAARPSLYSRRGALPLDEIEKMTVFLKNLAFTLYWNASDLAETNTFEDVGGLSALFGIESNIRASSRNNKAQHSLAGIEGVSQVYLKGLVTGLLRMLHERDSRRPFLPDKHWLMTSHVDMQVFIQAVVAEEEKRREIGDDDESDQQTDLDEIGNEEDASLLGWNIPRSRMGGAFAETIQRQRDADRKRRQAASLAPRLEILRNLPFFIPFETRVQIFREFIRRDQLIRRQGFINHDDWRMHTAMGLQRHGLQGGDHRFGQDALAQHRAEVHRDQIFMDAFDSFYSLGEGLKEPIQISFIDRFGNPEAGIDGGGVTKEFLTSITNEAFDPEGDMPMFAENDQHEIYPNPNIFEITAERLRKEKTPEINKHLREFLQQFEFLGRIVGKCMYEGILVDINFAGFFLLKWALTGGTTLASNETAYRASINDVKDFDNELYQGLLQLKNYPGDVEADFSLNFSVTDTMPVRYMDPYGQVRTAQHTLTRDLMSNGNNIAVNNMNRLAYIDQIARYRLQLQPQRVTNAFLKGLGQIIQPMWMAMFNQKELQTLVGGENSELDIADLRRNTQYNGLYQIGDDGLEHPTIALFWKVLREMSDEDRRKVLKFVTSTPRAPLLGFSNLNPPFTIHSTSASEGAERLPSTSTCVNLLKLPNYRDERTMRDKLLYAANSGAGFDLS